MKLKYSKPQIVLEALGALLMIAFFVVIGIKYSALPEQIPKHFNAAGEVDRWGSKSSIWFLPIVSVFLYALLTVVSFFPSAWNVPTSNSMQKAPLTMYGFVRTFLIVTKIELIGVFFYISLFTIKGTGLPDMFTYVFILLLVLTGFVFWIVGRTATD